MRRLAIGFYLRLARLLVLVVLAGLLDDDDQPVEVVVVGDADRADDPVRLDVDVEVEVVGEVAGPASDVFALGCTLAFAATARVTFGDDSIVSVMYRITTAPPDLTGVTEEHGFRQLVSECLANVVKHARATRAAVALAYGDGALSVTVTVKLKGEPSTAGMPLNKPVGLKVRPSSAPVAVNE